MSSSRPTIASKVEELISNRYESAIDGMSLKEVYYEGRQITAESTFLHPADLYLLTLLFKQALNENELEPLIEDFNNNSLYTAKSFQTAYQDMSQAELRDLVACNKDFQRKLQQMLRLQKPKFSIILSSMGMDSNISSHYISANVEYRAGQLFISIDDSFIDSLKTVDPSSSAGNNQLRNYESRLAQLFRALLAPSTVNITLNRTTQGQEAANCGIHAVINKINHEHGLKLNPALMVHALRKGIEDSYDSDLSSLRNTVSAIIRNQQNHTMQQQLPVQKSSAAKPAVVSNTHQSNKASLPNARYRLNFQSIQAVKSHAEKTQPTVPVNVLFEQCERTYTQAIDAIRMTPGIAENLKIAAIRNLFLSDNSKTQQPVSSFRNIVTEFKDIIAAAQSNLLAIEKRGPKTSQFASGLKNIRDQHKVLQNTLFNSFPKQPSYRR
jgi:hypothetical protein